MKYSITDNTKTLSTGAVLHQIRAEKDFADVHKGDLGGWIEKPENLSQEGECWVYDDAWVYSDAWVYGDAKVANTARVFGRARIYGKAKVADSAWVHDSARICENARIYGDVELCGRATIREDAEISKHTDWAELTLDGSTITIYRACDGEDVCVKLADPDCRLQEFIHIVCPMMDIFKSKMR